MSTEMVPTAKDLMVILDQVWLSYLDHDGVNPLVPVEDVPVTSEIHAWVAINGSWPGHVVVTCSTVQARNIAAAFLGMEPADVAEDDVADVLGELANIVGGNVKSMLPAGCVLSTPYFVERGADPFRNSDQVCVTELVGVWHDEPLSVALWHSRSDRVEVAA